jgi:GntR family transcriptional regulator
MVATASSRAAPRYRQVADLLQNEIVSGALQAGRRVPSERSIAEQHGLSRMTARQAVELLVRRGVVYRRPGSGTYVAPARIEHTLQRFAGFSEQMRSQGVEPGGRVLSARLNDGDDPEVEEALGLSEGERFWGIRRVRFGDGEPLMIERTFVPASICPDLVKLDLAHSSLYDLMRGVYGVDPVRAHETIEPTACEPEDARHLSTRAGAPALLVTRVTYDRDGRIVEHARDIYRGDRARFVIDRSAEPGVARS